MQKSTKSSVVAGILGIIFGSIGVHDWYLGRKIRGFYHILLIIAAGLLVILPSIAATKSSTINSGYLNFESRMNNIFIYTMIGYFILVVNELWGFIEGVVILAQGDEGLERKGYKVKKA